MGKKSEENIGQVYSRPLFELAKEAGLASKVKSELGVFNELFSSDSELQRFIGVPFIKSSEKFDILHGVLGDSFSNLFLSFLRVLLDRNKVGDISEIKLEFDNFCDIEAGIHHIEVTVPQLLSEEEILKLSSRLSEAVGGEIRLEIETDPSILGGIVIREGDRTVDNSVRSLVLNAARKFKGSFN